VHVPEPTKANYEAAMPGDVATQNLMGYAMADGIFEYEHLIKPLLVLSITLFLHERYPACQVP